MTVVPCVSLLLWTTLYPELWLKLYPGPKCGLPTFTLLLDILCGTYYLKMRPIITMHTSLSAMVTETRSCSLYIWTVQHSVMVVSFATQWCPSACALVLHLDLIKLFFRFTDAISFTSCKDKMKKWGSWQKLRSGRQPKNCLRKWQIP